MVAYFAVDSSGDGGIAGKGGTIRVSRDAKIYAYNGNRWTDDGEGHEYNENTAKYNQCPIFAQKGELREVYKYNSHWGEKTNNKYSYLSTIMDNLLITSEIPKATSDNPVKNIKIRNAIPCSQSGYVNPELESKPEAERSITVKVGGVDTIIDMKNQGIGSGAGYMELSNGTYTLCNEVNGELIPISD